MPPTTKKRMAKPAEGEDAALSMSTAAVHRAARGHRRGKKGPKAPKKFFHCYLLQSQDPKHKRSTYIGFTVDPSRRIRQHKCVESRLVVRVLFRLTPKR